MAHHLHRAARAAATVVALAAIALAGCSPPVPATVAVPGRDGRGAPATVAEVIDGDTVELAFAAGPRERVRLLGIDTPETVHPDKPVECFGPEASARTGALLTAGTQVVVQRDAEARDRFGRLLVYVWRRDDGVFVNERLVAEGLARPLSIEPNVAHRADLATASAAARAASVGLWGACPAGADRSHAGGPIRPSP